MKQPKKQKPLPSEVVNSTPVQLISPTIEKDSFAEDTQLALRLLEQNPNLAKAINEFGDAYVTSLGKLRQVCSELRTANLAPREQTVVLQHCGINRSRCSEIKKVVNDTPESFEKFMTGEMSFRLAVKSARGPVPAGRRSAMSVRLEKLCSDFMAMVAENGHPINKPAAWAGKTAKFTVSIKFAPVRGSGADDKKQLELGAK